MDFSFNEDQLLIQQTFKKFCEKELTDEYVRWMDENVDFPPDDLWQKFVDLGYFSTNIPIEYGGQGLGSIDNMIMFEQICKSSMSVALAVGVTAGFGTRFIGELGTKEQKEKYLPLIAEGKFKTCMALTEPGGGTDILGALKTTAEDKGDRWVINGQKIFITGAHVADSLITICKTEKDAKRSHVLDHHHGAPRVAGYHHPQDRQDQLPPLRERRDLLRQRGGAQGKYAWGSWKRLHGNHDRAESGAHRRGHDGRGHHRRYL